MASSPRVAVVGGGAVGITAAHDLADRGAAVTLYERDIPGSGATGCAAGLCYDAYADRFDAAVAARAIERFRSLGLLTDCPYVWAAQEGDDGVAATLVEQAERMQDRGRDVSVLDPPHLKRRFPCLQTDHLAVAAVAENAGHVDTGAYVRRLGERAAAAGVDIRTETPVTLADETTVVPGEGTGDRQTFQAVLVAAGAHTDALAATAGHDLALGTYRSQALSTDPLDVSPPMYYDASEDFYLRPHDSGVLVGGSAAPYRGDPDAVDRGGDEGFVSESLARIETALGVEATVRDSWAGLCTATPDRDPLLGACGGGLYVATGWHGHGFMRAPALGERIAEEILGRPGVDHFDPERFDGDEAIRFPEGIVD